MLIFLSGSFEDMGIFHVFIYLSVMDRCNPPPIKTKLKYVKNARIYKTTNLKKIYTVHNLITFSIVFTNKIGGGGRFNSPIKTKVNSSKSSAQFFQYIKSINFKRSLNTKLQFSSLSFLSLNSLSLSSIILEIRYF